MSQFSGDIVVMDELMNILNENGLEYDGDKLVGEIDSLQYMSLLVNLEEELDFEFPEEMLGQDLFSSFSRLDQIIREILLNN